MDPEHVNIRTDHMRETPPGQRATEATPDDRAAFLDALFRRAGIGITVTGLDRKILDANQTMEQMLGYGPGELAGKSVGEISHPEDERTNLEMYRDMMEGRIDRFQMEKRYLRRDGSVVHTLLHVTHISDAEGKPGRIVGAVEDITLRKRMEKELEESVLLLSGIREAQDLYIGGGSRERVFESLLDILVKVTDSGYGFLDDVLRDPDGTPYKKNLAMSNIAWDDESRTAYEGLRARNLEFRNLNNLAGAPVTEGRLVISNQPASDPRSGRLPEGHPALNSFMGIPLRFGDEIIGVAGVANREGGYTEEVARFIEPLTSTCASIISAIRAEEAERNLNVRVFDSLREKETLLKEIHHRVKNNLQVVSSLINLQAKDLEGSPSWDKFAEIRERIKTMAMIHERVYQSGNFTAVNMKGHIDEFARAVFQAQKLEEGRILFRTFVDDGIDLTVDQAIPCALIINELVTNALKHAFPGGTDGEIVLELKRLPEGRIQLEIRDNGTGLGDRSEDEGSTETLGLKLVRGLVAQLDGSMERSGDGGGTAYRIRFFSGGESVG